MISFVVPLFNEQESLELFYLELKKSTLSYKKSEIIFIDDGSTDKSLEILKRLAKKDQNIRIFSFRKNWGKAEALTLGFSKAKGDYIVTLDADLQDKPSEIKNMLGKIEEGYDLVCGWRKNRKDPARKNISSKIFNLFAKKFWGLNLHDYNCGLKMYKNEAAKTLQLYGGMHRFIPLLIFQQGFKVTEVDVVHEKRKFGKSKYGFSKVWKDLPDIFTMLFLSKYSSRPLHFFGTFGMVLFFLGLVVLAYLSIIHFQGQTIGRRPLLFFGMLLVLSGFQVFFTGFLADLFINLSHKDNNKEFNLKYSNE
ncbi:glycosyltransferase [Candidatus Microgenomates bacterium]|nr:MAG: glycosyltransferase [Candidatus Microgenomates bacterium]